MKSSDEFSLDRILSGLAGGLNDAVRKPNNLLYAPHAKQLLFHASQKKGRQYIGGNRSGKTTAGINEDIYWLRGEHPHRRVPPPPVFGRITTVDFKNGANKIILPNLKQWVPPSLLINGSWEDSWSGAGEHTLRCSNGSELEVMSYDQELDKFAGVPRHFTHFDEEPPEDIFTECKLRLVDYGGSWWMTMTPVEGMTWTFDQIFEPAERGDNPLIDIIKVNIQENTYLNPESIVEVLSGLDEDGVSIRGTGDYVAIGGLVFKHFNADVHAPEEMYDFVPPREWDHYISLDAGYNNPTAVHWHAVGPQGQVITYDEHYRREWTVAQHAELIKAKESYYRERYGIVPYLRVADPAIKQRSGITGLSTQIEYSQLGLPFALGAVRDVNAGLDKMNDYLRTVRWQIVGNKCPNLLKEMRTYKRARYATSKLREKNNRKEEPQKKDDHAIDGCRYFFSFMPDLTPQQKSENANTANERAATLLRPGTTFDPSRPDMYDDLPQQPVIIYDEFVGEF